MSHLTIKPERFLQTLKWISIAGTTAGVMLGIGLSTWLFISGDQQFQLPHFALFPLMLGIVGLLTALCFSAMIAPADFFRGPLGRGIINQVGTQSILVTRCVCGLGTAIGCSVLGTMVWAALTGNF